MTLSKEQILTLSLVKGIGPKKILAIGETAKTAIAEISNYDKLHDLMQHMKEKAILRVSLSDLNNAYQQARTLIETSSEHGIGLIGYYDEEFPSSLRNTVNEEGKSAPPLFLWYRGNLDLINKPGLAVLTSSLFPAIK